MTLNKDLLKGSLFDPKVRELEAAPENQMIKRMLREHGIPQRRAAKLLGISERRLRGYFNSPWPMPESLRQDLMELISLKRSFRG
jgi:DNA-binding NtrC family response regulator